MFEKCFFLIIFNIIFINFIVEVLVELVSFSKVFVIIMCDGNISFNFNDIFNYVL